MVKIYKLIYKGDIVYVGKTTQRLERRKAAGYGNTLPFFKECLIELIEETNDVSRERYWIERLRSEGHTLLNKEAGDGFDRVKYNKETYEKNKEKRKEYFKEYRKEYYEKNREKMKEYYHNNKENNKDKKREYDREYRLKNKLKI